jgi:hypothetical protein
MVYVFEYTTPNTGTRWIHQHYKTWRTGGMGWFSGTQCEWSDDIKVWDREYVLELADGGKPLQRFTINGNVFPGTIEWLGGGGSGYFNSNLITLKYGERSIKNDFDPSYSGEGIGAGKKSYISNDIPNGVINNGMTGDIPNVESNNLYGDCDQNGYAYIEILYP